MKKVILYALLIAGVVLVGAGVYLTFALPDSIKTETISTTVIFPEDSPVLAMEDKQLGLDIDRQIHVYEDGTVIESINNPADSETALLQVKGYSTSAEVLRYATGESVILNRLDPEYAEFVYSFYMSYTGKGFERLAKSVNNDDSSTVRLTIPYIWGYILTYTLFDGSKIQYNCDSDSIWYDTNDAIFKGPLNEDFRSTLEGLFTVTPEENILADISIQPAVGESLYRDNDSSTGIILRAVNVREGILEKDYMSTQDDGIYLKGEPCLLLTGQVESQMDQLKYMTMVARGYNADGYDVTHVLDHGPISGVISIELPPGGFGEFMIHLNAAPDLVRIELIPSNQLYDIPPP